MPKEQLMAVKKKAVKKTAKKATTTKRTPAKKAAPKKKVVKKAPAKKATARKTITRKAATKKVVAKKAPAKKAVVKKKPVVKAAPKKKAPVKAKVKTKRKPNAAFMRPMTLSEALGAVVGTKPIPRTEVTKKLWVYIKKNNLQDPVNRRMIVADEKLMKVFDGKKKVSMFEMTKLVSKHME
jgi:upstream activation factor subunit UAF30